MIKNNKTLTSWLILSVLVLVWGSSFILIKKSLLYFSGYEVGLLRIVITFLFLFPLILGTLKRVLKKYFFLLFISGIIGSLLPALLFAIAETRISSSLAGTLNSLTPLFTLIIGLSFFGLKIHWLNIAGVIIGLSGAIGLIFAYNGGINLQADVYYSLLVVMASVCYAINVNLVKTYFKDVNSLDITVLTFVFIGIPALFYVLFFTNIFHTLMHRPESWKGIGYLSILSIVGTALALIIFNYLIKISSPVFASSVTYIIPVIAIIWGIIDGEIFKLGFIVWIAFILLGVFLVNKKPLNSAVYKMITNLKK